MPILQDLVSDNSATFHFIQGPHEAVPPEGYEEYFGGKPYYRFVEYVEATGGVDVLKKIRDFPEGATAEDMLRELLTDGADGRDSLRDAINLLYRIMDEEGPFEGILGYSEGASIAATLLLTEQRRFQQEGVPPMLKCGVFFAGWPPMTPELDAMVLADESELLIDVPTCHIGRFSSRNSGTTFIPNSLLTPYLVGSLDPYLPGSVALYNVCDPDTAYLFDHGKGHTLPRDRKTVKELGDVIRNMIASVSDIAQ